MRLPLFKLAWLSVLLLSASCASQFPETATPPSASDAGPSVAAAPPAPLLLISLDGVRAEYLQRGLTPHIKQLADQGIRAAWMQPSYPALTFPNHYTLVTGLRPDHHGIINNTMTDAQLGSFKHSNREAVGDGRWWSGEPIWVGAEKAGIPTATLFWPGSEAAVQGIRPSTWREYDKDFAIDKRVDQILAWLAQPAAIQPKLITLYFEHVDAAGHDNGPDSRNVNETLRAVDAAIGRLLDTLRERGQLDQVNIIIVSDHGMAATPISQAVAVEDLISPADATVVTSGSITGFVPLAGHEDTVFQRLIGRHGHVQCWRKQDLPARWQAGAHPRVPPVLCQADEGWQLMTREKIKKWKQMGGKVHGEHGYDPALPSMRAIFIAHGPAFRQGQVIPGFDNVDVYPLLAKLVGIPPAANDGNSQTLLPILKSSGDLPASPIPH